MIGAVAGSWAHCMSVARFTLLNRTTRILAALGWTSVGAWVAARWRHGVSTPAGFECRQRDPEWHLGGVPLEQLGLLRWRHCARGLDGGAVVREPRAERTDLSVVTLEGVGWALFDVIAVLLPQGASAGFLLRHEGAGCAGRGVGLLWQRQGVGRKPQRLFLPVADRLPPVDSNQHGSNQNGDADAD